jgi:hypothetical protein
MEFDTLKYCSLDTKVSTDMGLQELKFLVTYWVFKLTYRLYLLHISSE